MKRSFLAWLLAAGLLQISTVNASFAASDTHVTDEPWKKTKNNTWPGVLNEEVFQYRIDKSGVLWWSPDGKKWELDADSMWADKEGSFFRVSGAQLTWSPDGGNTWFDSTEGQWKAVDGNWYRLDKSWTVWMRKDGTNE